MSTYKRTEWKDHVVDEGGKVIQQGTNLSQDNFNNEEYGIDDAHTAFATVLSAYIQEVRKYDGELVTESGETVLANTKKLPFNNSVKTVPLTTKRATSDYAVSYEVKDVVGGCVGDIEVSDKMQNGFKIRFDGDAKSVTIKYTVKGGGRM